LEFEGLRLTAQIQTGRPVRELGFSTGDYWFARVRRHAVLSVGYTCQKGQSTATLLYSHGQSLTIGLTHLEQFAWVGGMSASVANREFVLGGVINGPKVANRQLKLLWFACGKSDGLMRPNEEMDKALTEHGVRHTFVPMEGGHEWNVWRRGLEEFLPLVR